MTPRSHTRLDSDSAKLMQIKDRKRHWPDSFDLLFADTGERSVTNLETLYRRRSLWDIRKMRHPQYRAESRT
jgi:hypothetical protein